VVSGGLNKLMTAIITKLPKPLAARITATVMKDYYLKQGQP
jgi:hypothetical protein